MEISRSLALLLWIQSKGLPCGREPESEELLLSSPAPPHAARALALPLLTREAQALRPFQRQAEGRERVCCFSLLVSLSLTADHHAADQVGKP